MPGRPGLQTPRTDLWQKKAPSAPENKRLDPTHSLIVQHLAYAENPGDNVAWDIGLLAPNRSTRRAEALDS